MSPLLQAIIPAVSAFVVGILLTPTITDFLYKKKMWKKVGGKKSAMMGFEAVEFNKLHKENEGKVPRMGGIIIWASTILVTAILWFLAKLIPETLSELDYVTRSQTWIPFGALILGALMGLVDDLLEIKGSEDNKAGGLSLKKRLAFVGLIGAGVGWWFYVKLGITAIALPFGAVLPLGILFVPLVIIVTCATYAGGVIDGIDGLSGGVFASAFSAYGLIAYSLEQYSLAAFCAALVGSILAFLWFNIPPARFYMTETGSMALTVVLALTALLTDVIGGGIGILVLPVIALPLVLTVASNVLQMLSKKFRNGKKIFKIAPLHHHFEAIGWPNYKVTMRYWIFSVISSATGVILALTLI